MTLGNNLSISRKLAAGFASVLAVTIAVAAANFFATTAVDDAAQINAVAHRVVIDIERAAAAQYDQAHTARGYIITRVERHKILYGEAIGLFEKEIGAARQDAGDRPEILAAIAGVEAANIAWRHEIGDPEIAFTDDLATAEKAVDVAKSAHSTEMMKSFRAALQAARERISGWSKDAERSQAVAMAINETVLVAGSLLSLALAILANIWLARTVSRPAHAMTDVMHRLAEGNNTIEIPYLGRKDELGRMASAVEAFKQAARDRARLEDEAAQVRGFMELERETQDSEREAVSQARKQTVETLGQAMERLAHGDLVHRIAVQDHGSEAEKLNQDFNAAATQLQRTIVTIKANAQAIRSGTDEISVAAGDLSKRTEQQASRLEETATALNEITTTIRETAQGASRAHEIVSVAKDDALKSGDVVRHAIDAMGRIETSSRQIGQIIGVIDEIAFQTSLLALNAGVEAARAGDAGRGFAVVASEVRALAQRSAEAAKEIKSLISTSTGQVDQGVALVGRTGESLERIVMQVAEITAVISQIATSAHDQSAKLHRVNETVGEMDRVTQQNAAMVEETTAATRSLAQETAELTRLIGGFNIGQVTEFEPQRQRRTPAPVVSISTAAAARSAGRQSPAKPPRKVPAAASEDWTEF